MNQTIVWFFYQNSAFSIISAKISAIFKRASYNKGMKLDLAYKLTDKEGNTIDFDSLRTEDDASCLRFVKKMYDESPLFTDRSHSRSVSKHVIEFKKIVQIIQYAKEVYESDNIKMLFEYQNSKNKLDINVFNVSGKKCNKSIAMPDFVDEFRNIIEFKTSNFININLAYDKLLCYPPRGKLNKSEYAVYLCLARSGKPLSRQEISNELMFSNRAITYAFRGLDEKGLVTNINKTNSPRLNRYRIK